MDNKEAMAIRNKCASEALADVCRWIESGGEVAVCIHNVKKMSKITRTVGQFKSISIVDFH